ncbi:MAG TPA: hypothetical protein VMG59_04975 [Phycisphaerae bacterium]|nr:hypothetical protein [Phycisphaerae bacterium]
MITQHGNSEALNDKQSLNRGLTGHILALLVYFGCSFLLLIRIHFQIQTQLIAWEPMTGDVSIFIWFYKWWPYAISHGINPLITHVVWAPHGFDLMSSTSVPSLALLFWPVTAWWGPIAAYNLTALSAPALGAWFAYHLCRELGGKFWPSLIGGWLFGFSSYEMAALLGHANLFVTWPVPLLVWLVILRWKRKLGLFWFMTFMTLCLILLFGVSVEVFATTIVFGYLIMLLSIYLDKDWVTRRSLLTLLMFSCAAVGVSTLILSPYLVKMISSLVAIPSPFYPSQYFSIDAANTVIPTPIDWLGGTGLLPISSRFSGFFNEQYAYLGLPLLAMMILFAVEFWREVNTKVLILGSILLLIFSLGPHLTILGQTLPSILPWMIFDHLPLLCQALPARVYMYVSMATAVSAALWLTHSRKSLVFKFSLGLLAVLFLFPNIGSDLWATKPVNPPFFSRGIYKQYLSGNENVVMLPFWADSGKLQLVHGMAVGKADGVSMLWQAETNFYFRSAGGYLAAKPPPISSLPIYQIFLGYSGVTPDYPQELWQFIQGYDIRAFVVEKDQAQQYQAILAPLNIKPILVGGVELYQIPSKILQKPMKMGKRLFYF